jgi:hypothetical protein
MTRASLGYYVTTLGYYVTTLGYYVTTHGYYEPSGVQLSEASSNASSPAAVSSSSS